MLGAIILQVILIFLNAIFASAEIAILSANEARLEKLSENGDKRAKNILSLTANPSKFLSTIQVAITLAGLLGSAYAADNFAEPLVHWLIDIGLQIPEATLKTICVFIITLILSYFSIVLGELVPKRIAMKHSEKMALALSGLLRFVSVIFAPFVWILTKSTNAVLRLFHINPNEDEEEMTEEDIRIMLNAGSKQGIIDSKENKIIQNIFEFDDISVSEVCTHRKDVVFLYKGDTLEEWKKIISKTRHSFYPIYSENIDDVIGILNIQKFFCTEYTSMETVFEIAVEKPHFIPENMKADVLFTNMKEKRNYFAVVIDEYGGINGIITMHDLLELLVGDMIDKDDVYIEDIKKVEENKWNILGSASLERIREVIGVKLDNEECDTFGGYIFGILGNVPEDGTVFKVETDELDIYVETIKEHRIENTVVHKKQQN